MTNPQQETNRICNTRKRNQRKINANATNTSANERSTQSRGHEVRHSPRRAESAASGRCGAYKQGKPQPPKADTGRAGTRPTAVSLLHSPARAALAAKADRCSPNNKMTTIQNKRFHVSPSPSAHIESNRFLLVFWIVRDVHKHMCFVHPCGNQTSMIFQQGLGMGCTNLANNMGPPVGNFT